MKKYLSLILVVVLIVMTAGTAYAGSTYTVVEGDALWKIADKHNTTWQKLAEINKLSNPNLIFPGQIIKLAGSEGNTGNNNSSGSSGAQPLPLPETPSQNAVNPELEKLYKALDVEFAADVTTKIASCGTHPELGYRTAGSSGEYAAADYLYKTFKEIGLENVTKHETTVDTWSITKSDLYYTDKNGQNQKILLGGYPTTFKADNQEFDLIYLNKGTASDYEGIDAAGKIVLVDIDQSEEWWINWPAYQAKVKGAAAVIAANYGGYGQKTADTLGIQDTCGPSDAPAMSISNRDAGVLKELIKVSPDKKIKIKLTVDSKVAHNGKSHNISGDIPGKNKDEVIYIMGHYDGYFHAWHDDASGVGLAVSIAKAVLDSGYQPEKTIRIVAHGAEEWGIDNSRYDWAAGAFQQITKVTPEWAPNGFSVINCETGVALKDEIKLTIATGYELKSALEKIVNPLAKESPLAEGAGIISPATTWTEDFSYVRAGIPSMVSKRSTNTFTVNAYHTNMDLKDGYYSEAVHKYSQKVYATILYNFDNMIVKPLDFSEKLKAMKDSISDYCYKGPELKAAIDAALVSTDELTQKINNLNKDYAAAIASGDAEKANALKKEGQELNKELHSLFKISANDLTALSWEDDIIFPHDGVQQNLEALDMAIKALQKGDAGTALDEYLYAVDNNWYAYDFDKATFTFFTEQTTKQSADRLSWGAGLVRQGSEDLFDVIKSLQAKVDDPKADFSSEIAALEKAAANQKLKSKNIIEEEIKDITSFGTQASELL